MKIAYVITGLNTGGAERMLYHLLSKMNHKRFRGVVISLMDRGTWGDRIENLNVPVYSIGMKQGMLTPARFWRLIQTVHKLKPDLIQGWMYHGNLAAQVASTFYLQKVPVFWSIHHSISSINSEKQMTRAIIKMGASISKFNHKVIFVSKNSKTQHESLGYSSHNSCVIPNGFDTSVFKPSVADRLSFRAELGLSKASFLIGLIGRYHPMKDHANFLKASALLSKTNPDARFILAGTEVDNNNDTLSQLLQDLELVNKVYLLGERDDIARIIAALDILCLASAYGEAFPLVVGEAMSCGVPCVVTDVGDSAWIVGHTGRVVPPKNSEALANACQQLIDLGTEARESLGKAARERIVTHFSLDSVVAEYEIAYEEALTKKLKSPQKIIL